jgi:predicted ATPase
LLDTDAQVLFARLAVFAGGCTLDAAEAVASELRIENEQLRNDTGETAILHSPFSILNLLATLVENNLLRQIEGEDSEPRFTMFETIREYALERLTERGEDAELRERHAAYYRALAEQAEPEFMEAQEVIWLERLEQEHDNLRAALDWALEQKASEIAIRLSGALWRYWSMRGHLSEGRRWRTRTTARRLRPRGCPLHGESGATPRTGRQTRHRGATNRTRICGASPRRLHHGACTSRRESGTAPETGRY